MTTHLVVTEQCNHNCPLCCNKEYNMESIPVITVQDLKNSQELCITGGEPFYLR